MSNAATTSGLPRSRQKSCMSCAQGKRRCNRQTPICSRCAEKGVACVYSKSKSTFEREEVTHVSPIDPSERPTVEDASLPLHFAPVSTLNVGYLDIMSADVLSQFENTALDGIHNYMADGTAGPDVSLEPFVTLANEDITPSQEHGQIPSSLVFPSATDTSDSTEEEDTIGFYDKMADICESIRPWDLYDPTTRLHYIVERVKGFTVDIATRSATVFLHRQLYKDHTPSCIVSCFSVNVLYANRTLENTPMVMRALQRAIQDLVGGDATCVVTTPTPLHKLARSQSLFLYQIIRLLDGDVILRSQAEKDLPLLHRWLADLCRMREDLGADLKPRSCDTVWTIQPAVEWQTWIFSESVRRTIVMAYSFLWLYGAMTGTGYSGTISQDDPSPDPWASGHRWTISRPLWEAKSATEFSRSWNEKPHYIITNYELEHFLQYGRGADVDEFAEVLLSVYMGHDETHEFLASKH